MSASRDDIPKPRMTPRVLLRSILMLDDTPHAIALGTAIGMFVGLTPTVGVQMLIVLAVAFLARHLFRFNTMAAVLTVYVTNPLTLVPIYWFNYQVGTFFIPSDVTYAGFVAITEDTRTHWFDRALSLITNLGAPLLAGCLVVGIVVSLLTYPTMRWVLRRYLTANDSPAVTDGSAETAPTTQESTDPEPAASVRS